MTAEECEPDPETVEAIGQTLEVDPESLAIFIFDNYNLLAKDFGQAAIAETSWDELETEHRMLFMEIANRIWQELWNHGS